MRKEKNNFSVFKLFYNEIIYKDNSSISYHNVEHNIQEIKRIVITMRNTPKNNYDFYNIKLNRAKKRIKYHLGKITEYNNDIYKYFYLLYKTKCNSDLANEEDMPNILANSFYEDYKILKDGSYETNNVIPRLSSLEKKQIRDDTKNISGFTYLVKLLESSDNKFLYNVFLKKISFIFNIKPLYEESYDDYIARTDKVINLYTHLFKRLERKAKYSDDYELIKEHMNVACRLKFEDWTSDIKNLLATHFNKVYEDSKNDLALKEIFNHSNDITYQRYCELSNILELEKENLMANFESNNFVKINTNDQSYTIRFKENLINNYFDYRYRNNIDSKSSVEMYVKRALELYELSFDLANEIFERLMFDSSHSPSLMRNNDVNSALLTKIYDLYNPIYLMGIYQTAKNDFDNLLNKHDKEFIERFNKELNTSKMEYNYHGPIPNMENIKNNVLNRRKEFIIEHCITDLKSIDIFRNYDTRNYDLNIMAEGLTNGELVNLYADIKDKINNFDFSSMHLFDKLLGKKDELEKDILLKAAQEFIVKLIYNNLDFKLSNQDEIDNKYRDICYGYLNENILFIEHSSEVDNKKKFTEFLEARNGFREVSKWALYTKD